MGKARLAYAIFVDALDRITDGRSTGTPQEHVDRINEFLGRQAAQPEEPPRTDSAGITARSAE